MAKIRVLRLMEYIYDSVESMEDDRKRWQVQGTYMFSPRVTIRSTVLDLETLPDPKPVGDDTATRTIQAIQTLLIQDMSTTDIVKAIGQVLR